MRPTVLLFTRDASCLVQGRGNGTSCVSTQVAFSVRLSTRGYLSLAVMKPTLMWFFTLGQHPRRLMHLLHSMHCAIERVNITLPIVQGGLYVRFTDRNASHSSISIALQ